MYVLSICMAKRYNNPSVSSCLFKTPRNSGMELYPHLTMLFLNGTGDLTSGYLHCASPAQSGRQSCVFHFDVLTFDIGKLCDL